MARCRHLVWFDGRIGGKSDSRLAAEDKELFRFARDSQTL